jgi:dTMP kinase
MGSTPLFIVFEGIDGSGKSTQARLALRFLIAENVQSLLLGEPTDGPWGIKIRKMLSRETPSPPEEQHRLFLLDREEDAAVNIVPALDKGVTVIMDRYYYSNAAYQGAAGLSPDAIIRDNRERGFPVPDLVYLIDITPEEAIARIIRRSKGGPVECFEKTHFLAAVRRIYLSLAGENFIVIDGSPAEEEIHRRIMKDLKERFDLP